MAFRLASIAFSLRPLTPLSRPLSPRASLFSTLHMEQRYNEAKRTVFGLCSDKEQKTKWIEERRKNLAADIRELMHEYCDTLEIDIEKLSRKAIHVTGTKGKGSTCAFTEAILRQNGLKTGLYTSPHLIEPTERIRIDGEPITPEKFAETFEFCFERLQSSDKHPVPSFFRFVTLMAFKIFSDLDVNVAIVEVGVGGRTDATNVLSNTVACGIASIGFDHMNVLGPTLSDIAFEKSGIFKEGSVAFTVPQTEEVIEMIHRQSISKLTQYTFLTPQLSDFETILGHSIRIGLKGDHQKINASLALCLAETFLFKTQRLSSLTDLVVSPSSQLLPVFPAFKPSEQSLKALRSTSFAGRNQIVSFEDHHLDSMRNVRLFVDGAHTAESMQTTTDWFSQEVQVSKTTDGNQKIIVFIFSCTHDRNPETLLRPVVDLHLRSPSGLFQHVIISPVSLDATESVSSKQVVWADSWSSLVTNSPSSSSSASVHPVVVKSVSDSLERVQEIAAQNPTKDVEVLVTGSLYLVGSVLQFLQRSQSSSSSSSAL